MSAIFPGDLCVQTSVLAGDGYLVIVHVITDVAIAPGISHHSINCDTNDMENIGNIDKIGSSCLSCLRRKPSRLFSPWP